MLDHFPTEKDVQRLQDALSAKVRTGDQIRQELNGLIGDDVRRRLAPMETHLSEFETTISTVKAACREQYNQIIEKVDAFRNDFHALRSEYSGLQRDIGQDVAGLRAKVNAIEALGDALKKDLSASIKEVEKRLLSALQAEEESGARRTAHHDEAINKLRSRCEERVAEINGCLSDKIAVSEKNFASELARLACMVEEQSALFKHRVSESDAHLEHVQSHTEEQHNMVLLDQSRIEKKSLYRDAVLFLVALTALAIAVISWW